MRLTELILFVLFVSLFSSEAYALNLCENKPGYFVGFFNGVNNTEQQAGKSLGLIKERYGEKYKGEEIYYDNFYNTTVSLKKDILETVAMRGVDARVLPKDFIKLPDDTFDHYELFWYPPVMKEGKKTIDTEGIYNTLVNLVAVMDQMLVEKVAKRFSESNDDSERHKKKLETFLLIQKKVLLVAHSQGNLFVNRAFDNGIKFMKKEFPYIDPSEILKTLKVIHVAPASQAARGPYLLSDSDLVIKGLSKLPSSLGHVVSPNLNVPLYVPLLACGGAGEKQGHGFREVYFNANLLDGCDPDDGYDLPIAKFDELWDEAMSNLKPPPAKKRGFFTVSMRTISSNYAYFGLAVVEPPGGKKIYKHSMTTGTFGLFSSYDDEDGIPVQQYEENCEIANMSGGRYEVGIAQYTGSFDDKVIIEVKDHNGAILYRTKPFGMSAHNNFTSVDNSMHVLDIVLTYDFNDRTYYISLERVLDVRE